MEGSACSLSRRRLAACCGHWNERGSVVIVAGLEGDIVVKTIDDHELGVRLWGDHNGAPIFWLHPRPGSRMLRDPSDAYLQHGLAVCTYDRPGYGLSTRRPGRTLPLTVDDVSSVADFLGWERFAVAGYSGGGGPAMAVAALMADRVIRCAVVAGEAPPLEDEVQAVMPDEELAYLDVMVRADEAQLTREFEEFVEWAEAGMPGADILDPGVRAMFDEVAREARRQGAAGYIDDNIAAGQDWGFSVAEIGVPTKILAARGDTDFMHASAGWLADHIPGAELLWRPGGHVGAGGKDEQRLFFWLGHGFFPDALTTS